MPDEKSQKTRTVRFFTIEPLNPGQTAGWPNDDNIVGVVRNKLAKPRPDPYLRLSASTHIIEEHQSKPNLHISVSTIRHDNLPNVEEHGHSDPLPLEDDQNLAEPTHVVFLPDNVVGMVRGGVSTPGHVIAGSVLSMRIGVDVIFVPILRPEIEALVLNSLAVTKIKLKVAGTSFDSRLANAGDPVEASHRLINQFSGAVWANIEMTAKSDPDQQRFRNWLSSRMSRFTHDNGVEKAQVTVISKSGQREMVDLMESELAHMATWVSHSQTRHPDPVEIRRAIVESYEDRKDIIAKALEIRAGGSGNS